jgi:hypothetical protein
MFKNIFVCLLVVSLFTGCAGISIQTDQSQVVIVKSAARVFGCTIIAKDKNIIEPTKLVCNALLTGNLEQATVDMIKVYLTKQFNNDPIIVASFMDLVSLVKIDTVKFDSVLVIAAAKGCLEGISMCENNPNTLKISHH